MPDDSAAKGARAIINMPRKHRPPVRTSSAIAAGATRTSRPANIPAAPAIPNSTAPIAVMPPPAMSVITSIRLSKSSVSPEEHFKRRALQKGQAEQATEAAAAGCTHSKPINYVRAYYLAWYEAKRLGLPSSAVPRLPWQEGYIWQPPVPSVVPNARDEQK
jgi:hypothetical protein